MSNLLAREATVKTAIVEVKALTISKKQVTLAVFRQLKEQDLIVLDERGLPRLDGEPWGLVNYHWSECKDARLGNGRRNAPHIHMVWQFGDELRRSQVPLVPEIDAEADEECARAAWHFLNRWTSDPPEQLPRGWKVSLGGYGTHRVIQIYVPEHGSVHLEHGFLDWSSENRIVKEVERRLGLFLPERGISDRSRGYLGTEESVLDRLVHRSLVRAEYASLLSHLQELDHLFIAV